MGAGLRLAPLLTEIRVDIENFRNNMHQAAALGAAEAERIGRSMSTAMKAGESLSRAGDALTKGLTIPLAGVALATGKMAVDFESNFAKVSTLLDSNVVDFGQYKDQLLDASSKSKVAVGEFSEAVYGSISAGVDQADAIGFTTEAMKLAKGGFTDGAKAVDVLTTAINGYGLKTEDTTRVSDLLITTQNLGKTTVDELASSMGAVIPVANSVNFGVEELSASYAQLTKNGIATAESGTYLKAMLSELGKSGSITDQALRELTGKGFAELKKEGVPTADILNQLDAYAKNSGITLKDMFGSVEAGTAALVLARGGGVEYNEMLSAMGDSAGATQEAFDKMDATPAEKLKGALNELKNAGIKFGQSFVPVIESASDVLTKVADSFSNLTEKQQQNIIKWGAVLVAVGPVMKVVGGTITTFGGLARVLGGVTRALGVAGGASGVTGGFIGLLGTCAPLALGVGAVGTGIYAMHEYTQLMNRSVLESKEELSGMEKALAYLSGTEVKTKEEMEALGWVHKEFSDELSPEFQKAVENSTKKVQDFNVFLAEIGFDKLITPEESDAFNTQVNKMCEDAIKAIQSKKNESQKSLKELFVVDDGVVDEGEQKVLEILSRSSDAQIAEVDRLKGEIYGIKQRALDAERALNDEEIAEIEAHQTRIRQIELENLGGTQEEIIYAKNEFATRVETLDADAAIKLLEKKAKERDENILQTKADYNSEIEILKSHLGEENGIYDASLQEQITNLEADKQKKLELQNQIWDQYLQIVKDKNPEIIDTINKFNGEMLTQGDIHSQQRLYDMMNTYDGLTQITESGCYQIYNTSQSEFQNMRVMVDDNTGAITGIFNERTGEWAGYTEKMAQDAKEMSNKQVDAYRQIGASMGLYIDQTGQICSANGATGVSMDDLALQTDGTRQKIVDINGTPYEITVYKDGTISALEDISNAADAAADDRTIHIGVEYMGNASLAALDGVKGDKYGWHYNGLDNVPYDGYRATLHKDERVLTAEENKVYQMRNTTQAVPEQIVNVIQIGTREVRREIVEIADNGLGKINTRRI